MTDVVIYVARPTTDRGLWRVTMNKRAEHFYASEDDAMTAAVVLAQFFESAGEEVIVKSEQADGSWNVLRS